jgi:hypothetical protein
MKNVPQLPYVPFVGLVVFVLLGGFERRLSLSILFIIFEGKWKVVNHIYDGLVMKCVIQSLETGETATRFNYEITELGTTSYADLNTYMMEVAGFSCEDLDCLDESFLDK